MTTLLTKYLFSDLTRVIAVKALTRSQITSGLLMSEKTFSYLLDPLDRYPTCAFRFPGIPRIKREIVDLAGSIQNSNYKKRVWTQRGTSKEIQSEIKHNSYLSRKETITPPKKGGVNSTSEFTRNIPF